MADRAKDHYEKKLGNYDDVFADIFNVLVFRGEKRILDSELSTGMARSGYQVDGQFAEQERDILKYWETNCMKLSVLGIENQTKEDPDLAARCISYDGADYRDQLRDRASARRENRKRRNEGKEPLPVPDFHPVVTLVLYFGDNHWQGSLRLKDYLKIPEGMEDFVPDYRINLVEVAFLDPETVRLFKSDFRFVAEYFVQTRRAKEELDPVFELPLDELKHVEAVIDLMNALTNSRRFSDLAKYIEDGRKGTMMTYLFDEAEARGIAKGKAEAEANMTYLFDEAEARGIAKGREEGQLKMLIMQSCRKLRKGKTASQIAEELEEDLPVIQNIVITAADFAPDYDTDAIFKWMVSEKVSNAPN